VTGARAWALAGALVAASCARGGAAPADAAGPGARGTTTTVSQGATDEGGRVVRIALATGATAPRVSATGEWRLYGDAGRQLLARGGGGVAWAIERRGGELRAVGPGGATPWRSGPLVARPADGSAFVVHGGKRWRGELWLWPTAGGGVSVVNHLGVEDYLRGVVPLELNAFGAAEGAALEAQAVAARSYTFSRLAEWLPRADAQARASLPFDLRPTVADQVYGGVDAEHPASDRAVRATRALVLRYGGAVVSAPYSSACGGHTADAREVWDGGGAAPPYLHGVSDRVPGTEQAYCERAGRYRWTRDWDAASLQAVLERYLRRYAGGADAGGAGAPVGAIRALGILDRGASGRVVRLAVTTDAGRFVLRGNDIRFAVRTLGGEILPSTYFSLDAVAGGDGRLARVTLRGNGNGHGVGMCQWGAIGRARAGQDFRTILQAYFPGTAVDAAE
jgi:stage II sporulation protein D